MITIEFKEGQIWEDNYRYPTRTLKVEKVFMDKIIFRVLETNRKTTMQKSTFFANRRHFHLLESPQQASGN